MTRTRAVVATFWSSIDVVVRQVLQLVTAITLARLLTPDEFGTVAILSVFIAIGTLFVDGGLSQALIQSQTATHEDESTVFWCNLILGLAITLGLWHLSPLFADYFEQPVLEPLGKALSLTVVGSSLGSIQGTLLTKRVDFRKIMIAGTIASLISSVLGISCAYFGLGVWALAAQALAATAITTALLWTFSPWRPTLTFSLSSIRRLGSFGIYLFAAGLLDAIYSRGRHILIGKFYNTSALGFFGRAETLCQMPTTLLSGTVNRVAYPLLSNICTDKARMQTSVKYSIRMLTLVTAPIMLGLAAVAEPLVATLLGKRWEPSAMMLSILCLNGILMPVHIMNLTVLKAQGFSDRFFYLECVKKTVGIAALVAGSFFGVLGMCWAIVIAGWWSLYVNCFYSKKTLGYGMAAQLRDTMPFLMIAVLMASIVLLVGDVLELSAASELVVQVLVGACVYIGAGFLLRPQDFSDVLRLVRDLHMSRSATG